jgi:hypothetical protein
MSAGQTFPSKDNAFIPLSLGHDSLPLRILSEL